MFGLHKFTSTLCIASIISISLSTLSNAQNYQPFNTYGTSSAFKENHALYVFSGYNISSAASPQLQITTQSFLIDLSVSWDASKPVFKKLPDAPPAIAFTTLSADQQTITGFADNFAYTYNINSSTWTNIPAGLNLNITAGLPAALDPKTGFIYIPNGDRNINGSNSMYIIDMQKKESSTTPMPAAIQAINLFSVAWSESYQGMILAGGSPGTYIYSPSRGWKDVSLLLTGNVPSPRYSPCLVPALGGSKLILFGGIQADTVTSFNDIYVLDVASMVWTRGPDVSPSNGRAFGACAVSHGYLIAWGGSRMVNNTALAPRDTTIIYDIDKEVWVTKYIAPATTNTSTQGPSSTATATPNSNQSDKSNLSIALGVSFGVLILILKVSGFIFYRTRRARKIDLAKSIRNSVRDSYYFDHANNPNNPNSPDNNTNNNISGNTGDLSKSINSNNYAMTTTTTITNTNYNGPQDNNTNKYNGPQDYTASHSPSNASTVINSDSTSPRNTKDEFYSDLQNTTATKPTVHELHESYSSRPSFTLSTILSPLSPGPTLASMPRPIPARYTPEPVARWATTYSPEQLVRHSPAPVTPITPMTFGNHPGQPQYIPPPNMALKIAGDHSSVYIKDSYSQNTTPSYNLEDNRHSPSTEYSLPPVYQSSYSPSNLL